MLFKAVDESNGMPLESLWLSHRFLIKWVLTTCDHHIDGLQVKRTMSLDHTLGLRLRCACNVCKMHG